MTMIKEKCCVVRKGTRGYSWTFYNTQGAPIARSAKPSATLQRCVGNFQGLRISMKAKGPIKTITPKAKTKAKPKAKRPVKGKAGSMRATGVSFSTKRLARKKK